MKRCQKAMPGLIRALLIISVAILANGCQTFSMSEEDFAKQQHGGIVDRDAGEAVAVGGTAAYLGAMAAALASHF
jgi:hypothetical protein